MAILYSLRTKLIIFSSKSSPATLTDLLATIPPREITATSLVPPPISTIILPVASAIFKSAPIAAAIGSSVTKTCLSFAPAATAASITALFSTSVTPTGTLITTRGFGPNIDFG